MILSAHAAAVGGAAVAVPALPRRAFLSREFIADILYLGAPDFRFPGLRRRRGQRRLDRRVVFRKLFSVFLMLMRHQVDELMPLVARDNQLFL